MEGREYHTRRNGTPYPHCKDCQRAYVKDHYRRNKQYYIDKARVATEKAQNIMRERLILHLLSHPCVDCGEADPVVLEFDHVVGEKLSEVTTMCRANRSSWEAVEAEIKKCVIRCSNCHKRKTAMERGSWRLKFSSVGPKDTTERYERSNSGSSPEPSTIFLGI